MLIFLYAMIGLSGLTAILLLLILLKSQTPYGRLNFIIAALLLYNQLVNPAGKKLSLKKRREKLLKDVRTVQGRLLKMSEITVTGIQCETHNLPARIYLPITVRGSSLLLYFHGGGYVLGSLAAADNICRLLADRLQVPVLAADYRLAPEHPFPAAVEDAWAALQWAHIQADRLGKQRLILAGDSAGAALAVITALQARDRQGPPAAGLLMLYPWTNLAQLTTTSFQRFKTGYFLTGPELISYRSDYLRDAEQAQLPLVSPALAADLSDLPPAAIITAEFDILHDDGEAFAAKLQQAGNRVCYRCEKGLIHGFMTITGLLGKQLEETVSFIKQSLFSD